MFAIQVFRSLRFCLSPGILRGVVASLCLVVFGCGHGKVLSMQTAPILEENESDQAAMGLDKFFLHDECTGEYPPQPDTCLHGGRQLDEVYPTIRALPEVVASVGRQTEVLMDGGIRRGGDIVKALCLGARAVLFGRAYAYGLAAGGYHDRP